MHPDLENSRFSYVGFLLYSTTPGTVKKVLNVEMANIRKKKESGMTDHDVQSSFCSISYTVSTLYIIGDRALGNFITNYKSQTMTF